MWLSDNEPDWYPWGSGFHPWPCSMGRELWCRPAATASIQPLAWELPCVAGAALKTLPPPPKKSPVFLSGLNFSVTLSFPDVPVVPLNPSII